MSKHAAIYYRVSSSKQEFKSQQPDLKAWAENHDGKYKIYKDKQSGRTMDRPGWNKLQSDITTGQVDTVVVWRLDRLGRTASGLTALFDDLEKRKINLVSIKDQLDLTSASGRLMANVIASVGQYDNEVRGERVKAGQAVARANGKRWGGSKAGVPKKITPQIVTAVRTLKDKGERISTIARTMKLSRGTIYRILAAKAVE